MGIEARQWELMKEHVPIGSVVLSLGYPDILLPRETLPHCPEEDDADKKRQWHGWSGAIYNSRRAFHAQGWDLECIDFKPGPFTRVVDLNQTQFVQECEPYDAVFDPGTLEHVFNVGDAWRWVLRNLKHGGVIIHVSPVNAINHGLWSISPTTYADLYGDDLLVHELMYGPKEARQYLNIKGTAHQHGRFASQPELWNVVVAKPSKPFSWPIQHKYKT